MTDTCATHTFLRLVDGKCPTCDRLPTPAEPPDRCPACGCTEPCRDHGLARPAAPSAPTTNSPKTRSSLVEGPAAPAGSGWLTMTPLDTNDARAWETEAVAQRAAREAAERERDLHDEGRKLAEAGWEVAEQRAAMSESLCDGFETERNRLKAALAASTEREAGLRELCGEAIGEYDRVQFAFDAADSRRTHIRKMRDEWRSRLASLAAPEGGTTDG